jgi:DNA repair protein RadA/Sms
LALAAGLDHGGTMARKPDIFGCFACGATTGRWAGRCPACGAMNTIVTLNTREAELVQQERRVAARPGGTGLALEDLAGGGVGPVPRLPCGIAEFDRVLGGGLPSGGAVLLGGEPGIGKSTLLAQAVAGWAAQGPVLYVCAEESTAQVRERCRRLGVTAGNLRLTSEPDATAIATAMRSGNWKAVVVDSVQTVRCADIDGLSGSVTQVRAAAAALVEGARAGGCGLVLVGQVTKDGNLAGPRQVEHLVDTVLAFEGDRYHDLRTLRAMKNRFGSTQEIGLFRMGSRGLEEVSDPGGIFIADRDDALPGSCVVPALDGNRCLLLEVQALVNQSEAPQPARRVAGLDPNRVAMVLAVLSRRLRLPLGQCDVFVNVTGGARITEPAADLGVALAVVSAFHERPVPRDLAALGEIGLGGELRPAGRYELRAAEARRLGFQRLLGPGEGRGRGRVVVARLDAAIDEAFGAL